MTRSGTRAGFTLLETIIAFFIFSMVASMLISGVLTSLKQDAVSNRNLEILHVVNLKLASLGVTVPLEVGERTGNLEDGSKWTLSMKHESKLGNDGRLFRVDFSVTKGTATIYNLTTFKRTHQ